MENKIEGRNAVLEALRAGKPIDKLYVLDGCPDGPVRTIIREAKKGDTIINYVKKERLDQLSETGHHQGVIAMAASYEYATVEDILEKAREKGEAPFIFVLDNIEDPHIPNSESGRCTRCNHSKTKSSGAYPDCCPYFSRGNQLYTGCKSNQFKTDHGTTEKRRHVVCMCRYGRYAVLSDGSERTDGSGNRKRRRRSQQINQRNL